MAPSNLNQVFVANTTTTPALVAGAFSQTASSGLAANSKYGIWSLKGNAYLTGATSAVALMSSVGVLNSALSSVQFTQTMLSGNIIASPIIDVKSIKRIAYSKYKAPVRHSVAATFGATVPNGQSYMFKVAIRTYPTLYEAFANPTNPDLDLSGGTKATFPLLGNFSAGRTVIAVVEIPEKTTVANAGIAVTNAVQGNKILNDIFTVSDNGSGVVTLVARHIGVIFDVACNNTSTNSSAITTSVTGAEEGVGHYLLALSDEKSQRARYGNFNRMYFPMPFPTFAQSATNYDVIDISYEHNWPSSTGIARAGELNNIKIYVPSQAAASTNTDIVFGLTATEMDITAGTTTELLF